MPRVPVGFGVLTRESVVTRDDVRHAIYFPVELAELRLVLAVVVVGPKVVHTIRHHEHLEEQIPVLLRDVVREGLLAHIDHLVGILDERGLILVVTELRVGVDRRRILWETARGRLLDT